MTDDEISIEVERYDRIQSLYLTTGDFSALQQMNTDYPMQTRTLIEDVLKIGKVNDPEINQKYLAFYQDTVLQELINSAEQQYANMEDINKELTKCFKRLKEMDVEIHVRSTFLQGLFFKDRNTLPAKLDPLKKHLLQLDEYAASKGISVGDLALNYNLQNPYIDGVLIGVDNKEQLMQNFASVKDVDINIDIRVENVELLKPVNWN